MSTSALTECPAGGVLLVGSVPLPTAEAVMRRCGAEFGEHLRTLPDGEVGDRRYWVNRMHFRVFNGHADIEIVQRPRPDNGIERRIPHGIEDIWKFRVRAGVDAVRFGDPGERLGYAQDAIASWFAFRTLKEQGVIPARVRFQVGMPLPISAVSYVNWVNPDDVHKVRPGFTQALLAEVEAMLRHIPAEELAIQLEAVWELGDVYGHFPHLPAAGAVERNLQQIRDIAPCIPTGVALGYHLCFGTFGHWPRIASGDLAPAVALGNAMIAASGRPVDWLHLPAAPVVDEAYYAPLSELSPQGARVYLGLVHNMESFAERLALARRYCPDFGLSAYCGFGRLQDAELDQVFRDHAEALRQAGS